MPDDVAPVYYSDVALLINDNPDSVVCQAAATSLTHVGPVSIAMDEASLKRGLKKLKGPASPIVIDISVRLGQQKFFSGDFHGLEVAATLRRFHLLRNPIIFLSVLPEGLFCEKRDIRDVAMLQSRGSYFLSPPFTDHRISQLISNAKPISPDELDGINENQLDLHGAWERTIHRLETFVRDSRMYRKSAISAIDLMSASIERYAPAAVTKLRALRIQVNNRTTTSDLDPLRIALDELSAALKGIVLIKERLFYLPEFPPRRFETILVADDMPQDYLIGQLTDLFGYKIVTPQAMKLSDAKRAIDIHLPDIVLADMYFKRSNRESESGDKATGDELIRYALNHPAYRGEEPRRPMVIVTSKAVLDPETEIRKGAIDCSGSRRSSDPAAIHAVIWREAQKRGIWKTALVKPRAKRNSDKLSRLGLQRSLVRFKAGLEGFQRECNDTHSTLLSIEDLGGKKGSVPFTKLRDALGNMSANVGPTLYQVEELLEMVEEAQQCAKSLKDRAVGSLISDILHGGLGQYFHIPGEFRDLKSQLNRHTGNSRKKVIQVPSSDNSKLASAMSLREYVDRMSTEFGVQNYNSVKLKTEEAENIQREKIRIVVVEDNSHWETFIADTISDLQDRLSRRFDLQVINCRSLREALSELESLRQGSIGQHVTNIRRTLFIADLCIPSRRSDGSEQRESQRQKTGRDLARFDYGLELLELLTSYNYCLPTIVFSSKDYIEKLLSSGFAGIPTGRRIVKTSDSNGRLAIEIARIIEKADKYVILRRTHGPLEEHYVINNIAIPLPQELGQLFGSMYDHFQRYSTRSIEIDELIGSMGGRSGKARLLNLVYRLRKLIHTSFKVKNEYVDPKYLIETHKAGDKTLLRVHAEIMSIDDEEDFVEQLALERHARIRVRIVGDAEGFRPDLAWVLKHSVIESEFEAPRATTKSLDSEDHPDFVWIFDEVESRLSIWEHGANESRFGTNPALEEIELNEVGWLGRAIDASHFYGKSKTLGVACGFSGRGRPLIEILHGTDIHKGILKLKVNEKDFKMNLSPLSRILGKLLCHPNDFVSWDCLGIAARGHTRVSEHDSKNWAKRLRTTIENRWLSQNAGDDRDGYSSILEADGRGMRLSAFVIPYQNAEQLSDEKIGIVDKPIGCQVDIDLL